MGFNGQAQYRVAPRDSVGARVNLELSQQFNLTHRPGAIGHLLMRLEETLSSHSTNRDTAKMDQEDICINCGDG